MHLITGIPKDLYLLYKKIKPVTIILVVYFIFVFFKIMFVFFNKALCPL